MPRQGFERSVELKRIFNRELEIWRKKHGGGLEDLAAVCGVSPAYLAHVKRYGRVPGKPVLILLALHFELKTPEVLFHAAGINEPFPFPHGVCIQELKSLQSELFTISLNSEALAGSIRAAIREELHGAPESDFSYGGTIRVGLHFEQLAMFETGGSAGEKGFFLEFLDMLATNLRCSFDTLPVARAEYRSKLQAGEIDLFGPILPDLPPRGVFFTKPFCRVGRSALVRKVAAEGLETLPAPTCYDDLLSSPYRIAVIRDSREHLFANITLRKSDDELIICGSIEEALERLTMKSIPRTAHLFLCNSLTALSHHDKHADLLDIAFSAQGSVITMSDICLAVRPDWQQRIPALNQGISYLVRNGALSRSAQTHFSDPMRGVIEIPPPPASRPASAAL